MKGTANVVLSALALASAYRIRYVAANSRAGIAMPTVSLYTEIVLKYYKIRLKGVFDAF